LPQVVAFRSAWAKVSSAPSQSIRGFEGLAVSEPGLADLAAWGRVQALSSKDPNKAAWVMDSLAVTDASPVAVLARERLAVLRDTNDGFVIARRDLELRGPGELLGTRQTGLAQMRVADLLRDADLLPRVQIAAESVLRDWPLHVAPLIRRWVGHAEQYGRVG